VFCHFLLSLSSLALKVGAQNVFYILGPFFCSHGKLKIKAKGLHIRPTFKRL